MLLKELIVKEWNTDIKSNTLEYQHTSYHQNKSAIISFFAANLETLLQFLIHLQKVKISGLMLYLLHNLLQNLPGLLNIANILLPHPLQNPFLDLLKNGFDGVELGRAGRDVVEFNVLLNKHLCQTRFAFAVITVDLVQIEHEMQFPTLALYVFAEGAFLEVEEELLDDLEELLPGEEAFLEVEEEDAVDSASQQNGHRAVLFVFARIEAAAQLIDEDEVLVSADQRHEQFGVLFAGGLVTGVGVEGFD